MKYLKITFVLLFFSISLFPQSTVESHTFFSPVLGIEKAFMIYLPEGYNANPTQRYPVVYFMRNHETEWFNPNLRPHGKTLKDVADHLIVTEQIGKIIIVAPNTCGDLITPLHFGSINMLRPDLVSDPGIGTGAFEDYFFQDVIPHIDSSFRTIPTRCNRGIDGFSLGGYLSTLFGIKHPEFFTSVGSFDGTVMWYNLDDPDTQGTFDDDIWVYFIKHPEKNYLFDAMFNKPRDSLYMTLNSATNILVEANTVMLDKIRETSFHLHCLPHGQTNYYRNMQLLDSMAVCNIYNTFNDLVLDPVANHSYFWADVHASESLVKHWETFLSCNATANTDDQLGTSQSFKLFQNIPNPFNSKTTIKLFLPERTDTKLRLFNSYGSIVEILINKILKQGTHYIQLEAMNYSPGMYYYQLEVAGQIKTMKLLILK